jgi:hypothetical protein
VTPEEERGHELAEMRWHWDRAYQFSWAGGEFRAIRTDNGGVITACEPGQFREAVRLDYINHPVRRARRQDTS